MTIKDWIHHLINPHCLHCQEIREENLVCKSCEILKQQLEIANYEKKQLLDSIVNSLRPREETAKEINYEAVRPKMTAWKVQRQMLEAEDRERARILREQNKLDDISMDKDLNLEIEELEKRVGIITGSETKQ